MVLVTVGNVGSVDCPVVLGWRVGLAGTVEGQINANLSAHQLPSQPQHRSVGDSEVGGAGDRCCSVVIDITGVSTSVFTSH